MVMSLTVSSVRVSVLAVALWFLVEGALAAPYGPGVYGRPYYGQPSFGPPPGQYDPSFQTIDPSQFRPLPPNNAQGVPPGFQPPRGSAPSRMPGQMPYPMPRYQSNWPPGYPQGSGRVAQAPPPRLEWSLAETQPYLQQPVILRLELVSGENLSTANLELPTASDFMLNELEGPETSSRSSGNGRREIVNRFLVSLVPLRAGNLEVPAIRVTGRRSGAMRRFEAVTKGPIRLQVRPSMSAVRPWLPLKSLTLNAIIDREEQLAPGEPVTLALEVSAIGATAAQLPSLEAQLKGPDFRVYREQTLTDTGLSPDKRHLNARRTEYYTLVPQTGGRLGLPEMSIAWWNVELGVREVARLPIKTLTVRGGGPFGLSASVLSGSGSARFWLPLVGLLLLLLGYWLGVFYRGRSVRGGTALAATLTAGARGALAAAGALVSRGLARLRPAPVFARWRAAMGRLLPSSSRFLRCVRHANRAADPAGWCARFEREAASCLPLQGELTGPSMTRRILSLRPGADRATLTRLMAQLDAALYGRQQIDFPRWKREFMRQVGRGRGLLRAERQRSRIRWAALPALNPSWRDQEGMSQGLRLALSPAGEGWGEGRGRG